MNDEKYDIFSQYFSRDYIPPSGSFFVSEFHPLFNSKPFAGNRNACKFCFMDSLKTKVKIMFSEQKIHNKIIRIHYNSESGIDEGGLSKDWFVNINDEIIKSNAFIPTPDGTSLTFNNNNEIDNALIYKFTGQLIEIILV